MFDLTISCVYSAVLSLLLPIMSRGVEVMKHWNVGSTSVVPTVVASKWILCLSLVILCASVTKKKKKEKKVLYFSSFIVKFKCNSKDIAGLIIQIDILKRILTSFITLLTDY